MLAVFPLFRLALPLFGFRLVSGHAEQGFQLLRWFSLSADDEANLRLSRSHCPTHPDLELAFTRSLAFVGPPRARVRTWETLSTVPLPELLGSLHAVTLGGRADRAAGAGGRGLTGNSRRGPWLTL